MNFKKKGSPHHNMPLDWIHKTKNDGSNQVNKATMRI